MLVDGVTRIDLPSYQGGPTSASQVDFDAALPCFITGPENQLAVPVLQELLSQKNLDRAEQCFNPLVLTGASGSGKSHLARGIVRHYHNCFGDSQVAYYTAIDFAREIRAARDEDLLEEFRNQITNLSLLVIEDLQKLPARTFIQRELRDTIDALVEADCTVVITSQEAPAAMSQLEEGLSDRLLSGLTIQLRHPGIAARQELLQLAAGQKNLSRSTEELASLARSFEGSAAQLLRSLAELELNSSSLRDLKYMREPVEIKQIIAVVARYFSLTQAAIKSSARRKSLVHARSIVIHLARRLTDLSYAQIGQALGNRDHTTIMHAQQRMQQALTNDPETQQSIDELQRILTAN